MQAAVKKQGLFQFTPLREGRRAAPPAMLNLSKYFNSRPCVRGDGYGIQYAVPDHRNFNSRPCVRGDSPSKMLRPVMLYFNSRPCVRGDFLCCAVFLST